MHRRVLALIALGAVALPLLGILLLRGGAAEAGTRATPSFKRDVAPIIRDKCAGCHRLGGIAPFAFRTARDVSSRAPLVAAAVQSGRMPPWPPGAASPPFVGEDRRTLSRQERDMILRWVQTGARVDGSSVGSPPVSGTQTRPGETVRRLTLPVAYTPRAAGDATDDYRCFLVDPKLAGDVFVTSARIEPGQASLVHHVILFRVPQERVAQAQALDRAAAGPGWSCFGGTGIQDPDPRRVLDAAPWISAWAPGWGADHLPDGLGIPLAQGSRIVMQVHYNLLNGRRADRSRAVLTTVPATTGLTPIETMLLPAPVELPCAKGESGPLCNRGAALFDLVAKYGQDAGFVPAGLLLLCGKSSTAPLAGPVTSCDRPILSAGTIVAVAGHMHLLGRSIRVELNPGTPRAKVLLDIPRWNFNWQAAYTLEQPVSTSPGDVLRVTCRHDTSLRKRATTAVARKPRYILWGEGTTDEMCLGIVQVARG